MDAKAKIKFDEWNLKWETLTIPDYLAPQKNEAAKKTLTLLAEYVGLNKILPYRLVRLIYGHPLRRYTQEVEAAISSYFFIGITLANGEADVIEILSAVKKQLNGKPLIPYGDLKAIMTVVKDKTGVNYDEVDPEYQPTLHIQYNR
jgi:hypothetical protein